MCELQLDQNLESGCPRLVLSMRTSIPGEACSAHAHALGQAREEIRGQNSRAGR